MNGLASDEEAETVPPRPPKRGWVLMGDVLSARGGVPEHLIQWCRAAGEDDPPPRV